MIRDDTANSSGQPRRVAIVGGGLAGLSAAEALARTFGDRLDVTLYEARRKTGGRAGSFLDSHDDEPIDYCQHVAMGCCTNFRNLMQRVEMDGAFRRYSALTFLHPDHEASHFAPIPWLPAPLHLARILPSLKFLTPPQRRQIRHGMLRLFRTSSRDLRGIQAGRWLRDQGQEDGTIDNFWATFAVSALGEEIDRVDASAVRKVMVDGFAAARGASDVLVPTIPLSRLLGEMLPERVARTGVVIECGKLVQRITHEDQRARLQFAGDVPPATFDHVISAVPWHALGRLLPENPELSAIRRCESIPSSAISGVHLWLDREITEHPHLVLVGTLSQWLFRPVWRDVSTEKGRHYYQVVISASDRWSSLPKDQLIKTVMDDLKQVSPEAAQASVVSSRIVTDPNSVFSLSPEVMKVRPSASTPLPWFHLAGDWIDTGWPATMEGAVIGGRMAANSVALQLGGAAVEIDPGLPRGWLARSLIRT